MAIFGAIELSMIAASVAAFAFILALLVGMLLFAKAKLVSSGDVLIVVNGESENPIIASPGSSLLSALSSKNVFLPSACGGGGTCAMCKCQVLDGGGDVLPTELNHLTRKEAAEHWRLACQVKVRSDMQIKVPEEIFGIKKWDCTVKSNDNVATYIKEFVVQLPEGENLHFESGGYIQVDVPAITVDFKNELYAIPDRFRDDYDKYKIWDLKMVNPEPVFRAYSMANHPAEGNIIMLNIRLATPAFDRAKNGWMDVNPGICSSFVFSRKPGDKVTISGPYGEFFIKPTSKEMVYIGGGAGMAPLRSHIFHLFHTMKSDRKVSYWYGGRSKRELFYTDQFRDIEKDFPNFQYNEALSEPMESDNWTGYQGFIHRVLYDNYLSKHPEPEEIEYYLCGPPMMIQAVLKMLDDLGVPESNIAFDDFGS
jgi:Na+-transporting NADH:ubiquinone oxidoreductase subunit F